MAALRSILYKYKELYAGVLDETPATFKLKGSWFENICLYFFRHDLFYKQRYDNVWLWSDWPDKTGPDTGIDLVARRREDKKFCAIQCKFYEPEYCVSKADIDTFLAASGKKGFVERIIVSTSDKWNKNAEETIQEQQIPCNRLNLEALEQSRIDWTQFDINNPQKIRYLPNRELRDYQVMAVNNVINAFQDQNRGKMIMACGTGKTLTALKIAEKTAGAGKTVLFLAPSISLLNQTLLAWNRDFDINSNIIFFVVCSDRTVGRKSEDEDIRVTDLAYPATTRAEDLIGCWRFISDERKESSMTVIFSTYQSLQVISQIQNEGFPDFDLIICDEAHRTAGVTLKDQEDSKFLKVHDNDFIRASKRLYMTATPKVYKAEMTRKANEKEALLYSMDDENIFGKELYEYSFSKAIDDGYLTDYRVIILAIDEAIVSDAIASDAVIHLFKKEKDGLTLNDATKIVGCWRGLSKHFLSTDKDLFITDPAPMKTAIAFTSTIKNSKIINENFGSVISNFKAKYNQDGVNCEIDHVDGTMPMSLRKKKLELLEEANGNDENVCRVLSNAKCLSEGIDVPSLDAVLFLNPKKSKVDIVQCVGRVMRKARDKKFGYIILPVIVPSGMSPEEALSNSEGYNITWDVLQALRSIDDTFYVEVNSIKYDGISSKIIPGVVGVDNANDDSGNNSGNDINIKIPFPPEDWSRAIYAKLVQTCGSRDYEEKWARDMAKIAQSHTTRIKSLLKTGNETVLEIFSRYINGLRETINNSITEDDAIDMLSQHFITKPVFDAIFDKFSSQNPVSITMEAALELLETTGLKSETESLQKFYSNVKKNFQSIQSDEGRQRRIKDLYENFFKVAFPRTAERLGIVYTPNEIVDFILRSADWALKNEFDRPEGLSAKNVHILDPFTGTGTFIVRLLQLGLIAPEILEYKYKHELHANEILLLAYYVAAVNIETAYHSMNAGKPFEAFPGIVLTDTFNLYDARERDLYFVFQENSARANEQRKTPITVIVGNPPYSVGQTSANDNNKNLVYPSLDKAITNSYVAKSTANLKRSLYDSYIRAIRWASDRIEGQGIICYVTNGAFLESNAADGLRKCLCDEFQSIYIFNLRGNAYTQGEIRRKESGNVFGSGSRLPVAITLLVKNPAKAGQKCKLYYHDIGDYLKREEKLSIVEKYKSFGNMSEELIELNPNEKGDWINQRSDIFERFIRLGNKKEEGQPAIFEERYSAGVTTNRDAWCYNFSYEALKKNMAAMIEVYNQERERWHKGDKKGDIQNFVTSDSHKISWGGTLYQSAEKNEEYYFTEASIRISLYRPYIKERMYFSREFNNRVYLMPSIFPTPEYENRVISVMGIGSKKPFSVLMADMLPCLDCVEKSQCFPLYWYEESQDPKDIQGKLFNDEGDPFTENENETKYTRRDAISDEALQTFHNYYHDKNITKEDIFYYIYGVLSTSEYRERFNDDVKKMLARVPLAWDFWVFSKAGRELGELHINYENVEAWPLAFNEPEEGMYRVDKMKIVDIEGEKSIRYNDNITIRGIPAEAWEYIVNGKSALEWIVERYQDSTDKDSGLRNDCNAWGLEHNNPRYILDLIEKVVRVSVETVQIIKGLPKLGV